MDIDLSDLVADFRKEQGLDVKQKTLEAAHRAEFKEKVWPLLVEKGLTDANVVHIHGAEGSPAFVVVRAPEGEEYQRFRARVMADQSDKAARERRATANAELAIGCVEYPSKAEYKELVKTAAAIIETVAAKCHELARNGADELSKG